jgi:hypothetical protein
MNREIIGLIKETPKRFTTQDINKWKRAIQMFDNKDNPLRILLYEMYDSLILDGQVEAVWGKRRDAILNKRLLFVKDGQEDEQITALLNSPDFRQICEEIHKSILYAYTLIQINDIYFDEEQETYRIDFDLIPRENVHPERNWECISKDAGSVTRDFLFTKAPLAKYMLWAGNPTDKGLLLKAAPYIIYKRASMGDWSQFSEMFGMPFREAIYEGYDEDTRRKLESFLDQWGAGGSLVHSNNVVLKLTDTGGSTASSDVYKNFIAACNAEISKTIIGNTSTTEQGTIGARSLGEVHQEQQENKEQSDQNFVLAILNTKFKAILKTFGFNVTGGNIWFETSESDWTKLQTKWNVINSISDKVPVADDYIYEEFDIPKPDNYEELKEQMQAEKALQNPALLSNIFANDTVFLESENKDNRIEKNKFLERLKSFFV